MVYINDVTCIQISLGFFLIATRSFFKTNIIIRRFQIEIMGKRKFKQEQNKDDHDSDEEMMESPSSSQRIEETVEIGSASKNTRSKVRRRLEEALQFSRENSEDEDENNNAQTTSDVNSSTISSSQGELTQIKEIETVIPIKTPHRSQCKDTIQSDNLPKDHQVVK